MRITIKRSATKNGIHPSEIRAIISHYELRISIPTRQPDIEADDYFYVGRPTPDAPHIEIIADHIDPNEAIVFHAMMLKPNSVDQLGIDLFITPEYARQRPQRKD